MLLTFRKVATSPLARPFLFSTGKRNVTNFKYSRRLDVPAQTTALVAGRKWLPGALTPGNGFPEYIASPGDNFPAVYKVVSSPGSTSIGDFAKDAREVIERELHIHGALLFRGTRLQGGNDFSQFMQGLGYTPMKSELGITGHRHQVAKDVRTASDRRAEYTIELHNESAYLEYYPYKIFFFCEIPPRPGQGGETVIIDFRNVLPKLNPELVEKVRRLGIRYHRHLPFKKPGVILSWQEEFFTEDKSVVENYMARYGRNYHWEENGALTYWYNLPAFTIHRKTGQEVWFNQMHTHHCTFLKDNPTWASVNLPNDKYPLHTYYGDGSEIEDEVIQHIREVLWNEAVGFQMQEGDVLVLDNIYVGHARLGFTGERRLLASLTEN